MTKRAASKSSTQTDPAKHRGLQAEIRTMPDTLRDAGNGPGRSEATERAVSLLYARMANTFLKTQTAMEGLWNFGKPATIRTGTMTSGR